MPRAYEQKKTMSDKLDWRPGRWTLLALVVVVGALSGSHDTLAGGSVPSTAAVQQPADVTETALGRALRTRASQHLRALGATVASGRLRVFRDADGYLVVPRRTSLATAAENSRRAGRAELVPIVRSIVGQRLAGRTAATSSPSWVFAGGGCYERISDGWSWLDHCARVFRLAQDGDAQRDFYALQRYGTAGANMPWVLKQAELGSSPVESSPPMSWQDWSPRADRSGPCQTITVRITSPVAGVSQQVDRCETWDITKGSTGGDFNLAWSGCACVQDRELAYVLSVSVPQGSLPAWYVPAEVHGFAF
jgi:hypothetical protein